MAHSQPEQHTTATKIKSVPVKTVSIPTREEWDSVCEYQTNTRKKRYKAAFKLVVNLFWCNVVDLGAAEMMLLGFQNHNFNFNCN